MTFDAAESGIESGKPLEFYRIDFGSEIFYLTSHDEDVVFKGVPYIQTTGLSHTGVEASNEEEVNAIEITIPSNHRIAEKFAGIIPGKRVFAEVWKSHRSEIGGTEELVIAFEGFVATVRFRGAIDFVLKCRPSSDIFRSTGPRYVYSVLCNHTLYDARCKVSRSSFQHDGTITAISGDVITVNGASGLGATYFEGGFAEFPAGLGEEYRLILSQSGDDMRLLLPFADSSALGQTVRLFAGCKHDLATCNSKFANAINYGGTPYVPPKNPFQLAELR